MNNKRPLLAFLLFVIGIFSAFASGFLTHELISPSAGNLPILAQARNILERHALSDLPSDQELEHGMIRGMLDALDDPYTRFVEPAQTELSSDDLAGRYGGIGANLDRDLEGFVILYPFPEGPAAEAGIIPGDRLIQVDELEIVPDTTIEETGAAIRGPVGDSVSLRIARPPGYETYDLKIKRQEIPLPSVTWNISPVDPKLGIIKVNLIGANTSAEIETAIDNLKALQAQYFALDLRGNGGGLVDAGVKIAGLFLNSGDILQEQYRDQPVETYSVKKSGAQVDLPLVVFVDANTASASEIIAGALQAHGRAIIIGQPTFGKDSIQLAFNLDDGSSVHITAAKWWVPGLDVNIGETGLQPDIIVPQDKSQTDAAIAAAIEYFNQ